MNALWTAQFTHETPPWVSWEWELLIFVKIPIWPHTHTFNSYSVKASAISPDS